RAQVAQDLGPRRKEVLVDVVRRGAPGAQRERAAEHARVGDLACDGVEVRGLVRAGVYTGRGGGRHDGNVGTGGVRGALIPRCGENRATTRGARRIGTGQGGETMSRRALGGCVAACVACASVAPGATIFVDASLAGGANDGSSWQDAFRGRLGLAAALAAAQSGDEVWVANGVYAPAPADGDRLASFGTRAGGAVLGG